MQTPEEFLHPRWALLHGSTIAVQQSGIGLGNLGWGPFFEISRSLSISILLASISLASGVSWYAADILSLYTVRYNSAARALISGLDFLALFSARLHSTHTPLPLRHPIWPRLQGVAIFVQDSGAGCGKTAGRVETQMSITYSNVIAAKTQVYPANYRGSAVVGVCGL
jgi:hypothetical protein